MRKFFAILMVLAMLLPVGLTANADEVAVKPYYGIGSSDFNRIKFPNLEGRLAINVNVANEEVYLSSTAGGKDINKIISTTKSALDRYPEGMRSFVLFKSSDIFQMQEDEIYLHKGVDKLKETFTAFIKGYAEAGGKLDYIVLDVEYFDTYTWYLYSRAYTKDNPNIYKDIVENPLYQTEIRPMLVERGFVFYEDSTGAKPEIWSIYPYLKGAEKEKYANSATIWDTVMRIRLNNYMTEAVYKPLAQYMPNVRVYDYQSRATDAWLKDLSDTGEHKYVAGNSVPVGVTSHYNTYGSRLSDEFFTQDGLPVYNNPVAYNGAVYAATPFNRILWDVNLMKNMYEASGGNISITVAEYDYSPNKAGTPSNTPFYTESIFHIGLLDPLPFSIYMYDKAFESTDEYNKRAQVLQEIMAELTRVAGYADRKPIPVPSTWNSSFLLSGIYAGGRNLWRLTPDTDQVSLANFKVAGSDPTFSVNGQTITFPQGKIIPDGSISVVGTCGYWIETPKNVTPVVTTDVARFSKYPSFAENFEGYTAGTTFNSATAKPALCWQVSGTALTVQSAGSGKALALTGTATVTNEKLPQNITAGDYYAKQQNWEISFTLPANMAANAELKLLTCGDGGIKIAGGKVFYDENGTYKELAGVRLSAGQKYTVKRAVDFRSAFVCDYTVFDSAGKVIGEVKAVPMANISLPVTKISIFCANVAGQILLDDYKLYPTGVTADFEVYNAKTGIQQKDITQRSGADVAYRLSWLNGSGKAENGEVVATFYNAAGTQLSQKTVKNVQMKPGCDGVETGTVQVPQGQSVVLQLKTTAETPQPTTSTEPTAKPTVAPTAKPTTSPTAKPTQGQTVKPTAEPTTKPTEAQTAKPTGGQTVKPTGGQTVKPTGGQTAKPTAEPTVKPTGVQITKPTMGSSVTPTKDSVITPATDLEIIPTTDSVITPTAENEVISTETLDADPTAVPTQAPTNEESTVAPIGEAPEATEATEEHKESDDGDSGDHTVLWIVISAVVLGTAGAAAYFLYFKKKK